MPVVLIGPGVRTGVPLHVDNPREVGRRPGGHRAGRARAATAAGPTAPAGRSSSSTSAPRPTSTPSARTGSSSAAPSPPGVEVQPGRAGRPRGPAALGRAHRARRTRSARTPSPRCSPAWCSGSPAWSTAWSTGSPPSWWPLRRRAGRRRHRGPGTRWSWTAAGRSASGTPTSRCTGCGWRFERQQAESARRRAALRRLRPVTDGPPVTPPRRRAPRAAAGPPGEARPAAREPASTPTR